MEVKLMSQERSRWSRRFATGCAGIVAAAVMTPAVASAAVCNVPSAAGRAVYAPVGDSASYLPVPGGTFEAGSAAWSLNNASVVSGNESVYLNARTDSRSLQIAPRGTATSPSFCVSSDEPTMRFMTRSTTGGSVTLNVILLFTDSMGDSVDYIAGTVKAGSQWAASPVMDMGDIWPSATGQPMMTRIELQSQSPSSSVQVDDVFQDPYSRS